MDKLKGLLAHLVIALHLGLLTLAILDSRNPQMLFLTSGASLVYIVVTCAAGVAAGMLLLGELWKKREK